MSNFTESPIDALGNITNQTSAYMLDGFADIYLVMQSGPLYESTTERITLIVTLLTMLIIGTTGNALTVSFIVTNRRLHTPHMTALGFEAGSDMIHIFEWYTAALAVVIRGNTHFYDNYRPICCVERILVTGLVLGKTFSIGLLALERLLYFRYPYLYARIITNKTIIIVELAMYMVSFFIQLVACTTGVSYYSVTNLSCSLYSVSWYFPTAMALFLFPSGLAELLMVALVLHQVVSIKHDIAAQMSYTANSSSSSGCTNANKVHPFSPSPSSEANLSCTRGQNCPLATTSSNMLQPPDSASTTAKTASSQGGTLDSEASPPSPASAAATGQRTHEITQTMLTAIKLVGSMSLTYWLLYVPSMIVIFHVLSRVSLFDMELGKQPFFRYLFRIFIVFSLGLVRVVTPFFHYLFVPSLRQALWKLLHIKN